MAHQTGIKASAQLAQALTEAAAPKSRWRFLKVIIDNESLELDDRQEINGDWRQQYDACVKPHLTERSACYMLYRLDSSGAHGSSWLFLQYVHDSAPIRDKMLYSATAATLKKTFGTERFAADGSLSGTQPEDLCLDGYDRHVASVAAPPPLTLAEEERQLVRDMEKTRAGVDDRQQTLAGIGFAVADELRQALQHFRDEKLDYVQAAISLKPHEELQLSGSEQRLTPQQLQQRVPDASPRYHLFRWRHEHSGQRVAPVLFVYSTPGYKCAIKERMVYSSGRAFFVQFCESAGVVPDRRLEVDSAEELSQQALTDELHPPQAEAAQKFQKPKPPGRRPAKK